ncbi:MAG: LiaI-LiaF-like domain-containing protein [Acidimicrobiales bacterium]
MNPRVEHGALVAGVVFVVIGAAFLLQELDVWEVRLPHLLAVLLIGLGAALLVDRSPDRSPGGG